MDRAKRFFLLSAVFVFSGLFSFSVMAKDKKPAKKAFSLRIFSSTNLTGNLAPCG